MTKEDAIYLEHQSAMINEYTNSIYNLINTLRCKILKDGEHWCCLYGENLQEGIAGFGKTPHESVMNFAKEFGIN